MFSAFRMGPADADRVISIIESHQITCKKIGKLLHYENMETPPHIPEKRWFTNLVTVEDMIRIFVVHLWISHVVKFSGTHH